MMENVHIQDVLCDDYKNVDENTNESEVGIWASLT